MNTKQMAATIYANAVANMLSGRVYTKDCSVTPEELSKLMSAAYKAAETWDSQYDLASSGQISFSFNKENM